MEPEKLIVVDNMDISVVVLTIISEPLNHGSASLLQPLCIAMDMTPMSPLCGVAMFSMKTE